MELRQEVELAGNVYQLAEQHHVGQPLALYHIRPKWKRALNLLNYFLLTSVICCVLFVLVAFAIFFCQLLAHQIVDIQWQLQLILIRSFGGLSGCVVFIYASYTITQRGRISCLIGSEGLLMISRKKVEEITYWNEACGFQEVIRFGMPKQYMLFRVKRNPLTLDNIYEDFDELIHLVRQHIPPQCE